MPWNISWFREDKLLKFTIKHSVWMPFFRKQIWNSNSLKVQFTTLHNFISLSFVLSVLIWKIFIIQFFFLFFYFSIFSWFFLRQHRTKNWMRRNIKIQKKLSYVNICWPKLCAERKTACRVGKNEEFMYGRNSIFFSGGSNQYFHSTCRASKRNRRIKGCKKEWNVKKYVYIRKFMYEYIFYNANVCIYRVMSWKMQNLIAILGDLRRMIQKNFFQLSMNN